MNRIKNGMTLVKCAALMAVMMVWMMPALAQMGTNYSGEYYIANRDAGNYSPTNITNNFYLCPSTSTYGENMPFVTTYMTQQDVNSKWQVTFVETVDEVDYYTIYHVQTEQYLTYNEQLVINNEPRVRVHLQSTLGEEGKSLFYFTPSGGSYASENNYNIVPKVDVSARSLNPAKNNYNDYAGVNQNSPGFYTNWNNEVVYCGGLIGVWTQNDQRGLWYLEDVIKRPTIAYNSNNLIEITPAQTGTVTIKYTTNGTSPSATNGETYTGPFDPADDVTTIKAIAIVNGEASNVATFQPFVLLGSAHKRLIQNQNNAWNTSEFHFYMIPGDNDANNVAKVNTTSLFRPSMEWYFLNAGVEDGVQFYYVVNKNGKRLCYDATNIVYMEDFGSGGTKFKFKIVESSAAGSFNIIPYDLRNATGNTNRFVCKPNTGSNNGNAGSNPINLSSNNSAHSQWKFILTDALDKTNPFTVSVPNTNSYTYFRICNVGNSSFYIIPPRTSGNVTASNSNDPDVVNTMNWYFEVAEEANNSDWLTYFHIRNAVTGDYLYFTKDSNNSGACLEMRSTIESGNEERYMFTWAKTAATTECYYILPKLLIDVSQNQFSALRKADNTGTTLSTNLTRSAGVFAWTYPDPASPFHCAQPEIDYDGNQNGYVITATESDAKIYYIIGEGTLTPLTGILLSPGTAISVANLGVESATIRAIAARNGNDASNEATQTVNRVATPVITLQTDGTVTITCDTQDASIYYEMGANPSDPTTSSTPYSGPIANAAGQYIKAIAVKGGWINSLMETSGPITFTCATPVIRKTSATTFTIECSFPSSGVTIRYTDDGTEPTITTGTIYNGAVTFDPNDLPFTVKAIAYAAGYNASAVATQQLTVNLIPGADGYYEIANRDDFVTFITMVNENTENAGANYKITNDIDASGVGEIDVYPFTGELKSVAKADGTFPVISGLSHAIFNTVSGGVVKNIIMQNVNINQSGNVGAICNVADGYSRIYNCGILPSDNLFTSTSQIGSTSGYCGSIVGWLKDDSRVVNCFSFATIIGGSTVAGIVGYNSYESKSDDIRTMVMNCMFYGDITGGTVVSPVYGGEKITNKGGDSKGLNNFNYFCYEDFTHAINEYNCALGAEKRFLTRFEFHRILLNSNRELAAWYATGIADRSVMAKWVLDKSIAPYPILKIQDTYPSVVNPDYANAVEGKPRNQGGKLGTLTVNIQMGNGEHFDHPGTGDDEAQITTSQLILNITDKDTANFNYNYGKVQLPYYNQVGSKNYTGNRVVTGWKIVDVKGGEKGTFIDADEFGGRNFADREHWAKDFYGNGGANRIFNQGAYWEVPTDVYEITIEPYWAKCVYLSDPYYDVTYVGDAPTAIETMGQRYVNGNDYAINGSSQKVYTTVSNARTALASNTNHTPFDYAIVLVGNYHHFQHNVNFSITGSNYTNNVSLPYTFMSVDLDLDNEPDNVLLYQHGYLRTGISPVRFDFLHITGIGMAQKEDGIEYIPEAGTFWNYGWFEITNTSLIKLSQIEYVTQKKVNAPLILQGGMYENVYSFQGTEGAGNTPYTPYIHVGGNAFFNMFSNGSHLNNHDFTPHVPISVTGGDYDVFYLSGYRLPKEGTPDAGSDDAECYIDGGRFGEVAGAAMWQVDGNVGWSINNADIKDFYGGGINAEKPVTGTITTTIRNSYVDMFCGGPKFGDMTDGKAVSTTATGCTFGTFFGAGYGGTSAKRVTGTENNNVVNTEFNGWTGWLNQYFDRQYHNDGIAARYELIFFQYSGGGSLKNVAQIYINRVMFSLATTRGVTSILTDCTINGNFYGGGNLGKVLGNTTSTLTDCHVGGSVFGAGFSVSIPKVDVYAKPASGYTAPYCDGDAGVYIPAVYPTPTVYTWKHANSVSAGHEFEDVGDKHYILTTEDLTTLGTVTGDVSLTIQGNSTVHGSVFGGGDESAVLRAAGGDNGNTLVKILGKTTVFGNIYGGGNMGLVGGNTKVIINGKYTEQGTGTNGGNH